MVKKADLRRSKNSDLPPYVTKTARGFYLYRRRVPKGLAEQLSALGSDPAKLLPASGTWEHSLGSEPVSMYERASELTAQYDKLMPDFSGVGTLTPAQEASRDVILSALKTAITPQADRWKRTGAVMNEVQPLGPEIEREALALFRAQAFGGEATAEGLGIPVRIGANGALLIGDVPASAGETALPPPSRPAGSNGFMFDASRAGIEARQKEVAPKDSNHPLRLSQLLAPYSADQGHREGTANNIRRKANRFIRFAGDKPLWDYDHKTLVAYRDQLRADGLKDGTINQYMAALKMIWNAVPDRWPEYQDIQFPRLKARRVKGDVQDTRWKSFTDDQMKNIWKAMQNAWGPDADTRLTPARRRAYLMAVKVMLWTGLRPVEVFHLTTDNIVGDTIQIRYTKTHLRRTLPLCKHLADLPAFLVAGGFKAELEAGANDLYAGEARGKPSSPAVLAKGLRHYFGEVRVTAGITDPKQVLYSLKDTLVRRLQLIFKQKGIPVTYDTIRDIIGHKTKGALAHYVTLTGDMDEGLELIREALDAIEYW